jgi:branched-chain amino acid transport system permease protein
MNLKRLFFVGVILTLFVLYPQLILSFKVGEFWITLLLQIFVWTTLATSWNFFCGYSGYSSFGHGAFYGIGIYTTSTLMVQYQFPFLLTLPFAGGVSALAAFIIGIVVFRLPQFRNELFSLLTLSITFIVYTIIINVSAIDGGRGVYVRGADTAGFAAVNHVGLYYTTFAICIITVWLSYYIYYGRWGQALFAIRDDEDVARGLGVPTFTYKLWTFVISSFCVGLIGGSQAIFLGYLEAANVFSIFVPLLALMMAIFGGSGIWYGPLIGAAIITILRQLLTSGDTAVLNQMGIGVVLILTILFLPSGLAGTFENWRRAKSLRSRT